MDRLFFETKILGADDGTITALVWPFGSGDRVNDWIEPGAFKGTKLPLPMLFGHDMNDPVGAWLEAEEKADGYYMKGHLLVNDLPRARQILALVQSGAVKGVSAGFIIKQATARKGGGRTIKSLELLEVSLVTIPMHPGARVTSAKSAIEAIRIAEAINRAARALS